MNGRSQAHEDGLADQEMTDIELPQLRNGHHVGGRDVVEAVSGMDLKPQVKGTGGGGLQPFKLHGPVVAGQMTIAAGVKLNDLGPDRMGRIDLSGRRLDEQRNPDTGLRQGPGDRCDPRLMARNGQSPFGRDLLTPLGHQTGGMRPMTQGNRQHFIGHRHFEIQRPASLGTQCAQGLDIGIGDMPPVLAQVGGDAVGPGRQGLARRPDRIRMRTATRIPHSGHMVDIDAEADG